VDLRGQRKGLSRRARKDCASRGWRETWPSLGDRETKGGGGGGGYGFRVGPRIAGKEGAQGKSEALLLEKKVACWRVGRASKGWGKNSMAQGAFNRGTTEELTSKVRG